jgi:type VI secretion system protein ImpG
MDRRLLNFYNIELQHLRETAAEFARDFPKIAGRLSLDKEAKEICPDPFVERLLEGFAYLAARVHLKLDAEFPRFTQSILETVYPHYLSPTPSMAIVRFEVHANAAQMENGFVIPRGSALKASLGRDERTACEYRTGQDVQLWPIRLVEAQYYTRDIGQLELPPELRARAAIRIRLATENRVPFKALKLAALTFFLRGADELPVTLYEQIFTRAAGVVVQPLSDLRRKPRTILPTSTIRRVGFREDEGLLPYGPRGFEGYRLLHEYFAFPERFQFFELGGLGDAVAQAESDQLDLIIALDEQEIRLEDRVDATSFDLFCAPAINLFPMRPDRIQLTDRFSEYHVVADRTRPLDFEIYSVESVNGFGANPEDEQPFKPFYLVRDSTAETGAFFNVHRVPRVPTERERRVGRISAYGGSEVYLSLVDSKSAPYRTNLQQLGLHALCTNRHLPIAMAVGVGPTDFSLQLHGPIQSIRCISGPTPPRPPFAQDDRSWRIISHFSLNYLSLLDAAGSEGAVALRDLLKLYADPSDPLVKRQIEGLQSAHVSPIVRRAESEVPGPIGFARGLEVSLRFDEDAFEGTGVFILGAVLEQFLRRYVSLNSFTETVILSQQRGEIIRWPARIGKRHLI